MTEMGNRIKALRESHGLTQDAFAELLHVTRQTVSNYENSRSRPDLDMLAKIARVLDTDVAALLGADPVPQNAATEKPMWTPKARSFAIRRLVISSALLVLLVLVGIPLKEWAYAQRFNFYVLPQFYMKVLFYPAVWALGGWSGMQALEVLCGLQPLQARWCRYAKWALLAGMVLPQLCLFFWASSILSPIPMDLWITLWNMVRQPAWYAIFGAALWLFGFLTGKQETPTA